MIPKTREEKFLYRGSVGWVLRQGSIEDFANLSLGTMHLNDSKNKI